MHDIKPVFLTAEIREIERLAVGAPDSSNMMERAGLAAAQITRDRLLTNNKHNVLVLAGPGNNGGDAFVVARYLKHWGYDVTLVFTGDPIKLSYDARYAMDAWLTIGAICHTEIPANKNWHVIIDGLFGIGLDQKKQRNLEGKYVDLVNTINDMNLPVLALDIPSGLGSDNGSIYGIAVRAAITVTFIGQKPGLLTNYGLEYCGEVLLRDLDLDVTSLLTPHSWIIDSTLIQRLLPLPRSANSHKGTFGSIGIAGGSKGMIGAALLAGRSALKMGAGRVYLGLLDQNILTVDTTQPELMLRSTHELFKLNHLNCLVMGPGLGTESAVSSWIDHALNVTYPLVLDADALNHIAIDPLLAKKLSQRKFSSIITPHPAEAARLLKTDVTNIQNDRMNAALELSKQFNCHVVLKGAGSICALSNGQRYLNTSGNPGLSSAGTGDVLSGMIGSLITQGVNPEDALLLAVYMHGAAADSLLKKNNGPIGMTASEIIVSARSLLNQWIYHP